MKTNLVIIFLIFILAIFAKINFEEYTKKIKAPRPITDYVPMVQKPKIQPKGVAIEETGMGIMIKTIIKPKTCFHFGDGVCQ